MLGGCAGGHVRRYGQLSGMVEPVAGVLGAVLVALVQPVLPYALAFAAGAMIYVVRGESLSCVWCMRVLRVCVCGECWRGSG